MKKKKGMALGLLTVFTALALIGCGQKEENANVSTDTETEKDIFSTDENVTMEQIIAAQDRKKLVEYYGDVQYEFSTFWGDETGEYLHYYVGDDIYYEEGEYQELICEDAYFYAHDENGYFAGIAKDVFDVSQYDNYIFGTEEERAENPQIILETSVNGDNLTVVTQYDNPEFVQKIAEGVELPYDENCILKAEYIMDIHTLALFAGKEVLVLSDGTEHTITKYNGFYSMQKNEYPEKYLELKERMEATENVAEYTVHFVDDDITRKMNLVKGDEFGFVFGLDEEEYGLYFDAEGQNPVGAMTIQSEEDSVELYVIKK